MSDFKQLGPEEMTMDKLVEASNAEFKRMVMDELHPEPKDYMASAYDNYASSSSAQLKYQMTEVRGDRYLSPCQRLQVLLERVTYKPGWTFACEQLNYSTVSVCFVHSETDVLTGKVKPFASYMTVYEPELARMDDRKMMEAIVCRLVKNAEMHEMDEWLKLDGEHVVDPHPEVPKWPKKLTLDDQMQAVQSLSKTLGDYRYEWSKL